MRLVGGSVLELDVGKEGMGEGLDRELVVKIDHVGIPVAVCELVVAPEDSD